MIGLRAFLILARLVLAATFLGFWQIGSEDDTFEFLFGSPVQIFEVLRTDIAGGGLTHDWLVTGVESVSGLVIGTVLGLIIGFALSIQKAVDQAFEPFLVAAAAVPIFSIAPMTIIWFGVGIWAKIILATLAVVFVAITETETGIKSVDRKYAESLLVMGAPYSIIVWNVLLPAILMRYLIIIRASAGFAVTGAFVGEFIASDSGLGHYILRASGLYDTPRVIAGVLGILCLVFGLRSVVTVIEKVFLRRYLFD